MTDLKLKICGMKDIDNIREVIGIEPDFIGFIFYQGSPRYAGERIHPLLNNIVRASVRKVGVFVDEPLDSLLATARKNDLDLVQLHGKEDPEICHEVRLSGFGVIKTFAVGEDFDYRNLENYTDKVDYFLFDTKDRLHGGSGRSFEWGILNDYPCQVPYFLSGGIGLDNIDQVTKINSDFMKVIDVNSRFEISPGIKDIVKLRLLREKLKQMQSK